MTLGLLMLVYPLVKWRELDWTLWTFASMLGSLVVLAGGARPARGPDRAGAAGFGDALVSTLWFPVAMFAAAFLASFLLPRRAAHHDPI